MKFLEKNKNLKIVRGDILDEKILKKEMKNHQFVFHLAANSDIPAGLKKSKLDFNSNVIGTINVLESMVKNNIKQFAYSSSSAVFGYPSKFPTSEEYGPCLPESLYGASKLATEGYISAYANLHNIKSWIFRFANITGIPATHGIIFDFVKKSKKSTKNLEVLGNGMQKKSYLTNELLVDAILFLIKKTIKNKKSVMIYNIGNSDAISIKTIAEIFIKETKSNKKISYTGGIGGWKGDVHKMRLDIKKIIAEGWSPKMNSKQCIMDSIKNNLT
jgi:UDP-glucose 4-epimerase